MTTIALLATIALPALLICLATAVFIGASLREQASLEETIAAALETDEVITR